MPISDQVIELETKKKGRNIIFIVLIALLAAASVAFAVLWVTKAPAVDPPAIEKITVGYTDMSQTSTDSNGNPIFKVSPSCVYTIEFDLVLKEGSEITDVNTLVEITSEPAKQIIALSGGGVNDPENPTRYVYNFAVASSVDSFNIVASSDYTSDTKAVIKVLVNKDAHTETFDVGKSITDEKYIYELNTPANTTSLKLDESKSDSNRLYYKANSYITYYADPFTSKNKLYRIDLMQLGEQGINGQYGKITAGGGADEVKLEVGTGASYGTANFVTVTSGSPYTQTMDFSYGPAFMGEYCSGNIVFRPSGRAEKVYLRLTANVNNSAAAREIIIELQIKSTNELDKITQIIFTDPYTGVSTELGTTKDTLNLYATGTNISFDLANCITVKRGLSSTAETAKFEPGRLEVAKRTVDNVLSVYGTSELVTLDSTKTGTDTIIITDKESGNLGAMLELTVRVYAALDEFNFTGSGDVSGNEYSVDMASGTKVSVPYQIKVPMLTPLADFDSLKFDSELAVEYPSSVKPATEVKDDSIYVTDIAIDNKGNATLNPKFARKDSGSQYITGNIEFTVGKNVESNSNGYIFTFKFAPQGINKQPIEFTVKLVVTQIATSFKLDYGYKFTNPDEYTVLKENGTDRATLTLAIGSVTSCRTNFTLKDIIRFYVGTKPTDDSRGLNYGGLTFEYSGGEVGDIFDKNSGRFVVPLRAADVPAADIVVLVIKLPEYTFRLSIEYKMPVVKVTMGNEQSITELPYSAPAGGLSVGNQSNDKVQAYSVREMPINDINFVADRTLFNVDLFVIVENGGGSVMLMPKKQFESGMSYYYFLPDTDMDNATKDDAVFRMNNDVNMMKNHELVLLKDLYELSVNEHKNLQNIRIYYSYGKSENIYTFDSDGKTLLRNDPDLAVYSEYHFVRKYDGVKLYSDLEYKNEITKNTLTYPNGSSFIVAGSGVVNLSDGTVDVVERTKLDAKWNLSTVGLDVDYNETHLSLKNGTFTVNLAEGNGDTVTIVYTEHNNGLHKAQVTIDVSNDALEIDTVKLFADSSYGNAFEGGVLYKHGGNTALTLYYEVTYKNYTAGNYSTFESFAFDYNSDSFSVIQTALPVFGDSPSDYDTSKTPGFTLSGGIYIYRGSIKFELIPAAEIGNVEIVVKGGISGAKATTSIKVTSIIDGITATVNANGSDTVLSVDSDNPSASEYIQFKYSEPVTDSSDKSNKYYFDFAFTDGYVDYSNLHIEWNLTNANNATVTGSLTYGLCLSFGNTRIVNGKLVITITETDPSDNSVKTYTFTVNFGVDVPVENLEITVAGNGVSEKFTADSGNKDFDFTVTSTGNGESSTYNLNTVINGGVDSKQPISQVKYELIKDNLTDNTFALSGNVLTVKNVLTASPASLKITVGDFVAYVHLILETDKLEMSFVNSATIPDNVTDNSEIDFGVKIVNSGTGTEITDATVKYACDVLYGDVTASINNNGVFKLTGGGNGEITVVATYDYSGGTLTLSKTLKVNVPLSNEIILLYGAEAVSALTLAKGQEGAEITVKIGYSIAALGYAELDSSLLSVTSSNPSVAGLSISGSTVTVLPLASGSATVTVKYGNRTATVNVTVELPTLTLTSDKNTINVFDTNLVANLAVYSDKLSKITVNTPTTDSNGLFTVTKSTDTRYTLTLNKSGVTQNMLGKHVITVTAIVTETNELLTATVEITLTAENYNPLISITSKTGTVTEIDRASYSDYTLSVSNMPSGFGESATSVVFAASAFNLNNENNKATVTGINSFNSTTDNITVSVTVFGKVYTGTLLYTVADSGTLVSSLYYSTSAAFDLTSLIDGSGAVSSQLTAITSNGLEVGFDNDANPRKIITLVTEYTNAPMAVLDADRKSFSVATPVGLTLINYDIVEKSGHYYYIAQYTADNAGEISFVVSTVSLGGKQYSASAVTATLNATAPAFALSTTGITLSPGMDAVLQVNYSTAFKGDVTYEFKLIGGENILSLQSGTTSNSTKIVAAMGITSGCSATVAVTVTVTSGVYKDEIATLEAHVTVGDYSEPAFTVTDSDLLLTSKTAYDLSDVCSVTHDSLDTNFAYTLTFSGAVNGTLGGNKTENKGTIANYVYTPNAANGSYDVVNYTFKVTSGYFAGKEVSGNIKITVMPQVTLGDSVSIFAGKTYDVLGDLNVSDSILSGYAYSLDNNNAGTVDSNGVFTAASNFAGSVTVTLTATMTFNGHSESVSVSKNIQVIAVPELKVTHTESDGTHVYTANAVEGATFTLTAEENGQLVTISGSGNVFNVTENTDKFGGTVKLKLTMTLNGDKYADIQKEYSEYFYITVSKATEPTIKVTVDSGDNGGRINVSISGGYTANYEYAVIGGGITVDADGNYTLNKTKVPQTAIVKVTATV